MADVPALTLTDQAFFNLAASLCFWTPDRTDRDFVEKLVRELVDKANANHPLLGPVVIEVRALLLAAPARRAASTTRLGNAVHDFLRWRGLMAMDRLEKATASGGQDAS
jgi:hypothetical protein